jgi:protein-disulfide isomerase
MRLVFFTGLLILGLTAGCKAQNPPASGIDPQAGRRIEVMVRTQFNLPADYEVNIGARKPSQFTGYDTLPITFKHGERTQTVDFLISADNAKLVHLDTIDLTKNPSDAIPVDSRPVRGNPQAKVTVVNFDDLECPYCGRMHQELFPATMERYKGLVRFVYKDDPLVELHPWAMHAAVDANCLAEQSSEVYWTFTDYVHGHGQEISGETRDPSKSYAALDRIARQEATLGKLDEARLNACIAKQDESVPRASAKLAQDLGIEGTPAVYVNGERVNGGAVPQEEIWIVIDRALRAEGIQPPPPPLPVAPLPAAPAAPAAATAPAAGAAAK